MCPNEDNFGCLKGGEVALQKVRCNLFLSQCKISRIAHGKKVFPHVVQHFPTLLMILDVLLFCMNNSIPLSDISWWFGGVCNKKLPLHVVFRVINETVKIYMSGDIHGTSVHIQKSSQLICRYDRNLLSLTQDGGFGYSFPRPWQLQQRVCYTYVSYCSS